MAEVVREIRSDEPTLMPEEELPPAEYADANQARINHALGLMNDGVTAYKATLLIRTKSGHEVGMPLEIDAEPADG